MPTVTFENNLDISRLEKALSMILSAKYECDIKVRFEKKEGLEHENNDSQQ